MTLVAPLAAVCLLGLLFAVLAAAANRPQRKLIVVIDRRPTPAERTAAWDEIGLAADRIWPQLRVLRGGCEDACDPLDNRELTAA